MYWYTYIACWPCLQRTQKLNYSLLLWVLKMFSYWNYISPSLAVSDYSSTCWKVVISEWCLWTVEISGKLLAFGFIVSDKGSSSLAFVEDDPLYVRYLVLLGICHCVMRDCMTTSEPEVRLQQNLWRTLALTILFFGDLYLKYLQSMKVSSSLNKEP